MRFKNEVSGVSVKKEDNGFSFETKVANVELWSYRGMLGISLTGRDERLDTGFWHTDEHRDIDIYFWYAVGALREGVKYKKNIFGRDFGWVYSEEMSIWMGVSTESGKHFGTSSSKFVRRLRK